jgi:hypothetical protein
MIIEDIKAKAMTPEKESAIFRTCWDTTDKDHVHSIHRTRR